MKAVSVMISIANNLETSRCTSTTDFLRNTALLVPCLFACLATFLMLARSHLYTDILTQQQTWLIGLGILSTVAILRTAIGLPANDRRSLLAKCSWYLQSLTILQMALLLSVTSQSVSATGSIWAGALLSESYWWIRNYKYQPIVRPTPPLINLGYTIENDLEARLLQSLNQASLKEESAWTESEIPDHANQFWIRSVDIHGESISASQRIQFEAGQRHQNLHLSFIPELPSTPCVEATLLEGPDVELIVGESHDFGIRLDLKLKQIYEEPVEVLVQVEVFAEAKQAA